MVLRSRIILKWRKVSHKLVQRRNTPINWQLEAIRHLRTLARFAGKVVKAQERHGSGVFDRIRPENNTRASIYRQSSIIAGYRTLSPTQV